MSDRHIPIQFLQTVSGVYQATSKDRYNAVIDGTWKQYWQTNGIGQVTFANHGVDVKFGTMVPESVANYCNDAKNSIINGTYGSPL